MSLGSTAIIGCILVALIAAPAAAAPRSHVVQLGETLSGIALHYNLSVETLARANGIADPAFIRVGQRLVIPEALARSPQETRSGPDANVSNPKPTPSGKGVYIVRPGDTLYAIARRYGTTVRALTEANQLTSQTLQIGQRLRIPGLVSASLAAPGARQPIAAVAEHRGATVRENSGVPLTVGAEVAAPRPMRVRRGPRTYFTTLALLSAGTPLHVVGSVDGWYQVQLPDAEIGWVRDEDFRPTDEVAESDLGSGSLQGSDIVREALTYLGVPYVWGGQSQDGVDCSGFVYVVFAPHLRSLARTSSFDYFQTGIAVERLDLQPGDLVFFTTYAPGASHVGIYVGDGRFIHASSASHRVSMSSLDESYYSTHYVGARRLLKP